MNNTMSTEITLRNATTEDCQRLWEWRNDPHTRESSFDTSFIPYQDHENWFLNKLRSSDARIFIAVDSTDREVGYVRFNLDEAGAEVSISIDRDHRGKGYGSAAIRSGAEHILRSGVVQRIVAYVKFDNPGSLSAFERAGFVINGTRETGGVATYQLVFEDS